MQLTPPVGTSTEPLFITSCQKACNNWACLAMQEVLQAYLVISPSASSEASVAVLVSSKRVALKKSYPKCGRSSEPLLPSTCYAYLMLYSIA